MKTTKNNLVSIHGGHSNEFCSHADDPLELILQEYIVQGFTWVGLTEHIPPPFDAKMYQEERSAGLTAVTLRKRFASYIKTARALQKKYRNQIQIFVGSEGEAYSGYAKHIQGLCKEFTPDYFLGSVHHLYDICFDESEESYEKALEQAGSYEQLYTDYYDQQLKMIETVLPDAVAHFDYIRRGDEDYQKRMEDPKVWSTIVRNLTRISELGIILDYNVSPLRKGHKEPYPSGKILTNVHELGIILIPGDDSHGIDQVGAGIHEGITNLKREGFDIRFPAPEFQNM